MTLTRRNIYRLTAMLALCSVLLGVVAFPAVERHYMRAQAEQRSVPLTLAAEGLLAALNRYAPLPALIAERPELQSLLLDSDNAALRDRVNENLRQTAIAVKASDVFVMDITGRTLAAASYGVPGGYVGRNFSYQSYFNQALNGGLSSFSFYGTTTGDQGYFYAAPVEQDERIIGVLAIKFNVDAFESSWTGAGSDLVVYDRNGFVFMSSRPDWHFRALRPISRETQRIIAQNRQYPIDRIELLPMSSEPISDTAELMRIETDRIESFVYTGQNLSQYNWTIGLLSPTRPATLNAIWALLTAGLVTLVGLGMLLIVLLRQSYQAQTLARETAAKEALEGAVARRTADLSRALADLRQTQTDLIQAGKLSALGQMSAAFSHEFNQPLAAVKSYAHNARLLLERGDTAEARENMSRISKMVDRMVSISQHLRNFARRPQQAVGPVDLDAVVRDAMAVIDVRARAEKATIAYTAPPAPVWVTGGHVRLQQVLVNLINNALDAMAGQQDPVVTISVTGTTVTVSDTGAGIAPDVAAQIFDPFFTTKTAARGLGLGLSISYNIVTDFGGTISAQNGDGGGCEFSVILQPAAPAAVAAQ